MTAKRKRQPQPQPQPSTVEVPMILSPEALADLKYIEPNRARDRLIACLNEIYVGLIQLQQQHGPADHA